MLFSLPTSSVNFLSHFGFYRISKTMRMDPVLIALAFHCVTKIDWSSPGGLDNFLSYDFAMGPVQGYSALRTAPGNIKRFMLVP